MNDKKREILYKFICALEPVFEALQRRGLYAQDDRWITLGGGKENEWGESTGRHVKIDEQGNIVGGALPKSAQGKSVRSWWKSSPSWSPSGKSGAEKPGGEKHSSSAASSTASTAKSAASGPSVFGKEKPLTISTYYRGAKGWSGGYWGDEILEASSTGTPGEIKLDYPTDKDWKEKTSKTNRTNYVDITIKAGFKNGDPYNLDFDHIDRISGRTYGLSKLLHEKGFKWNGETWTKGKPESAGSAPSGSSSLPQLRGSEKQIAWAESIRTKKLPVLKKYADTAQSNLKKLSTATEEKLQPLFDKYGKERVMSDLNAKVEEQHKAISRYQGALKEDRASWWIDNR